MQYDEGARIEALNELGLLNSPPTGSFDRITRMAGYILDASVSKEVRFRYQAAQNPPVCCRPQSCRSLSMPWGSEKASERLDGGQSAMGVRNEFSGLKGHQVKRLEGRQGIVHILKEDVAPGLINEWPAVAVWRSVNRHWLTPPAAN